MTIDGRSEFEEARKKGLRAYNTFKFNGLNPYLPALDEIVNNDVIISEVSLGMMNIPVQKIKGTKTHGRATSFAPNFMPILLPKTEFGAKWINLCKAHMSEGIRDPIKVYEYLNWYYVEEGNKRVSVLKFYEAVLVPAEVIRLIPKYDPADETVVIYYEFLSFYKKTKVNYLWMSKRENFSKLLRLMKKYNWIEDTSEFESVYYRFRRAYHEAGGNEIEITTGDAFLKYLEIYAYDSETFTEELPENLRRMWNEFKVISNSEGLALEVDPDVLEKRSFLNSLTPFSSGKKKAKIAFINSKSPKKSAWTYGHEIARHHLDNVFKEKVETKAFNDVPEDDQAYESIKQAVEEGYEIIFTTSPTYIHSTLKAAMEFSHVKFLNCSQNVSYKHVRTYFGRIYEANFLVGLIAGAMTKTNTIGYVATYPISEVISSLNAFTIGARFVNPFARVIVKWVDDYKGDRSKETYDVNQQLKDMGADILSHQESMDLESNLRQSGIYYLSEDEKDGRRSYLATPIWNWGEFYERIVRNIMNGSYNRVTTAMGQSDRAISYWWGLDTEVVDLFYSQSLLPKSLIQTIEFMKQLIKDEVYHPFRGPLMDVKGKMRLEEDQILPPDKILTMDWLVEGVMGSIPSIDVWKQNHPLLDMMSVKKRY